MVGSFSSLRLLCSAFFASLMLCLFPAAASAQTTTYTTTTAGAITDQTCGGTGFISRTINVGTSYSIADVNLGVMLDHTYRGDLRITLTSPTGTTVSVMTNVGGAADNLNVLFDDEAGANISTHTANDTSGVPPVSSFQRTFIPTAALSAFDGQNASGNWTLTVCDSAAGDLGTFLQASLIISAVPTNYADLSMTKTVSNATPANGTGISYTLTVTNAASSPNSATGVTVLDLLPAGTTFVSATGTGSYASGTGIWTVGTLAPGASATLTINATVNATSGAVVTNGAEVRTSSIVDLDSTPNNGSTNEDDDAFASFTVTGARAAGTPPALICPTGSVLFDWAAQTWVTGTLNNNLTQSGVGTFNVAITPDFPLVTGSPAINTNLTGGTAGPDSSLFLNMNNSARSQVTTTTITLPTAVPGMQFRVHDVDFGNASYADKVVVTGSFNGSGVTPTLTNGVSNYVAGNTAIGDAGATDTTADGNVTITFASPVDTVTIVYGNHTTAPADPGNQWMSIYDITMCRPVATLAVAKISSVLSDGVSASNPKAIPGAIIRYCITVQNNGSGTAANVTATDILPANVTYVPASMVSGASCGAAATAEDDDNVGADETDPYGMAITGTTVSGRATAIAPGSTFAMVFHATVN
jgi:uncharacterized repeat protein (TIGR01451 family)